MHLIYLQCFWSICNVLNQFTMHLIYLQCFESVYNVFCVENFRYLFFSSKNSPRYLNKIFAFLLYIQIRLREYAFFIFFTIDGLSLINHFIKNFFLKVFFKKENSWLNFDLFFAIENSFQISILKCI